MKKLLLTVAGSFVLFNSYFSQKTELFRNNIFASQSKSNIQFVENKGQVKDQNYQARTDILFSATAGKMDIFFRNNGVSYQLYRTDKWKEIEVIKNKKKVKVADQQTIYRIDLNWKNANSNYQKIEDEALHGYNNYYLAVCRDGALNVKQYKGFSLINLYDGINLHYYEKNGELKHDYIVSPHSDYQKINLQIEGAKVTINEDGSLLLHTPLGIIQEGAPLVYQNKKQLNAKWKSENNILSFEIENCNPEEELIIDPVTRVWGTYYGGEGNESEPSICTDVYGNVYLAGYTDSQSGIATSGSYQNTISSLDWDAYLVQFDNAGVRQWSTYYGGTSSETNISACADGKGNVYLSGGTYDDNLNTLSTPGAYQTQHGGFGDGFLAKFDSNGTRIWGTYLGGTGAESFFSSCLDSKGNIYLVGNADTTSISGVATSGCHQGTIGGMYDAFLVKFDSSGIKQWGTYYGGIDDDFGYSVTTDTSGNVFFSGESTSANAISTSGSHQPLYPGNSSSVPFLVKFNNNGVRTWGTYYGDGSASGANSICTDKSGNIFLGGGAFMGGSNISTSGSHQVNNGGGWDAFLVKFNNNGVRQWGTYYGGSEEDNGRSVCTDSLGNVFLTGWTYSGSAIATSGSHQTSLSGQTDAFFVKFNNNGVRQWGTYYGGPQNSWDAGYSVCKDPFSNNIYLAGLTSDSSMTESIATAGSQQENFGGGVHDAFLVKLLECFTITTNAISSPNCGNDNGSLQVSVTNGTPPYVIQWSNGDFGWTADSLFSGQYVVQVSDAAGCYASQIVNLNASNGPVITNQFQNNVTCPGGNDGGVFINASGGTPPLTYQWSNGLSNQGIFNLSAGIYDLIVEDATGCQVNASYMINEPDLFDFTFGNNLPDCANNNGSITVSVTGGTPGYNFTWSTNTGNQTGPIANNLGPGIYSFTVTDGAGCTTTESTMLSTSASGPALNFNVFSSIGCGNSSNGFIDMSISGTSPFNVSWNTGANTEDISNLSPGSYYVVVTDGNGCASNEEVIVDNASGNVDPEICIVTVDSSTQTNKVVWEKPGSSNGIKEYKIFREGSALGVYSHIATIPFDSLSEFTDSVANPAVRAWRYKISHVDSCGTESARSANHKTVHLAINNGLGGVKNLAWDDYEGFYFQTFNVWRYHSSTGWIIIDSLPSNLHSYTDLNPPTGGTLNYAVEILKPTSCGSTRGIINTTRSNVRNVATPLSTGLTHENAGCLAIFPNPTKDNFTIELNVKECSKMTLCLLDIHGREVLRTHCVLSSGKNLKNINITELSAGIYITQISIGEQILRAKLVKEN